MGKKQDNHPGPLRVAIAAGGTGGHIMPALALAEALTNAGQPVRVDFVCGNRPVELQIYAAAGIHPIVFPVGSMARGSLPRRIGQYARLALSFIKSLLVVGCYDVVVGMGGYISGPFLAAAWLGRVPIVLHDSNTVLGRVNRALARRAAVLACGMPLIRHPGKVPPERIFRVGTPVRRFVAKGSRQEAAQAMYLREDAFTLFINGGSQGARGLNDLMARTLGHLCELWPDGRPFQVIWSTGSANLLQVREALKSQPLRGQIWIAPSIERMDQAYAISDLVIGRAGGSTLAEVLLCELPSILIPLPHAAENHQYHNADVLARHGAALVCAEHETSPETLAEKIADLAAHPTKMKEMADAARRLSCPDAGRDLARIVVETAMGKAPRAED
jgi:UDP-N-acetylglucosamine--N-acetylmuramyl-(pentapeptide) pyrophosphoryl-undecaprenol N-acetylglucosamine transferase